MVLLEFNAVHGDPNCAITLVALSVGHTLIASEEPDIV
jgi:hypothetical protein